MQECPIRGIDLRDRILTDSRDRISSLVRVLVFDNSARQRWGAILARGGLRANVGGRSWRAEVCAPTLGVNPGAPNLGPTLARQSFSRFDFVRQRLARKRRRADLCGRYSNYYVTTGRSPPPRSPLHGGTVPPANVPRCDIRSMRTSGRRRRSRARRRRSLHISSPGRPKDDMIHGLTCTGR